MLKPEVTADELAREAGLPVSTIRMYQRRRLLAAPRRQGRNAYYDDRHRERLRLIGDLQARGYSLAAIGDLTARLGSSSAIDQLLRVPSSDDDDVVLAPADLAARFAGSDLRAADVQRAGHLGLVALAPDGRLRVRSAFLDAGSRLAALGVPVSRILDEFEQLRRATDEIAARFVALYSETIWPAGPPAALDALHALGPLALDLTAELLAQSLRTGADEFAEQQRP